MELWNGKNKALTFSFDDGVTQDKRLVDLLNKYGLKGTFNINSARLGLHGSINSYDRTVDHTQILKKEVATVYAGHEVAVHTLTHPNLTTLDEDTIIAQVEDDRKMLESLVGYRIRCMAYPCGGVNNDDRVADIIRKNTAIRFARTITSSNSFDLQENLLRFNPSVYYCNVDQMFSMGEEFIRLQADRPQLFYIWGHSYELDTGKITWERFEEFCRLVSGKDDIYYGTNGQCLLAE